MFQSSKSFLFISLLFLFSSCLKNLNQEDFFRKLEIKNNAYHELITSDRGAYEASIKKQVEETIGDQLTSITYWGESRYYCGDVISKKEGSEGHVICTGEFEAQNMPSSKLYMISFVPKSGGKIKSVKLDYY